jgi:DNA-directed RNA polymerase specialized sigma24 family protein
MDDPSEYAEASRAFTASASRDSDQQEPAVLARLAHTEALLAVAAALERLARPGQSGRQPAAGQADPISAVRERYPNAYTPWTEDAEAALLQAHRDGHDITVLAETFGRQPSAVRSRLHRLGAI